MKRKMTYGEYVLVDMKALLLIGWTVVIVCTVFDVYPIQWYYWLVLIGLQVFYWVASHLDKHR